MTASSTSPLAPLREVSFTTCWLAGTIAHSANWMQTIAVPILIYQLTGSATWLGLASVAAQGPALLGSPLGGALADRYSKRPILLVTLSLKAGVALSFLTLHGSGALTPSLMVGLLLISGLSSSANIATWQAFVSEIVPRHQIPAAYRLNAIQFNGSRAVGPALAGFVIAQFGMETAFLVNAWAYAPLAVTLFLVRPRRAEARAGGGMLSELLTAARTVRADKRLWIPVLIVGLTSMFGQGLHQLLAGIAKEVFDADEQGVGILMSSVGISSVFASLIVIGLGDRVRRSTLIRAGFVIYAAGLLVVAATDLFWVGVSGMAITGIAHVLIHVSASVSVQAHVADALRARVTSIYLVGIIVGIPIGAQLGGLVADATSFPVAIVGSAVGIGSLWLVSELLLGRLRDLDP